MSILESSINTISRRFSIKQSQLECFNTPPPHLFCTSLFYDNLGQKPHQSINVRTDMEEIYPPAMFYSGARIFCTNRKVCNCCLLQEQNYS